MVAHLGGERIDSNHVTMLDLAEELDLELVDYDTVDPALSRFTAFFDGRFLSESEILDGYAPIGDAIEGALSTLEDPVAQISYRNPNGAEPLDALSIRGWLDSVEAAGPVRELLEVAYVAEFGLDTDVSNALNLLATISTGSTVFDLFGDSDRRFHVATGTDSFISRLSAPLDPARTYVERELVAIRRLDDSRYEAFFDGVGGTVAARADHVVLALPFSVLRGVDLQIPLPAVKRRAIDELGYGASTKLACGFDSRYWQSLGSDGSTYTDLGYASSWDTSRPQVGDPGILSSARGGAAALAAESGTPETESARFLDQLEVVFPGARSRANGVARQSGWNADVFARGGLPRTASVSTPPSPAPRSNGSTACTSAASTPASASSARWRGRRSQARWRPTRSPRISGSSPARAGSSRLPGE
ncbi:MAG: FAD-dependent oxidoreductase [Deltaproteobacteria bacterium]|nr:FAD-dependent oxidoreductase [Deltaproteobacteria bacterium]